MSKILRIGRMGANGLPVAPPEIRAEVSDYARENGRTATVHYVPFGGWFVRFSLRPDDKRLRLSQEQRAEDAPTEDVWFHVPKPGGRPGEYIPLDIHEMGVSGVRQFLERGNTWSGRGEFSSIQDAAKKAGEANEAARIKYRADQKEANRHAVRERRRSLFKIPFLRVGIDLGNRKES